MAINGDEGVQISKKVFFVNLGDDYEGHIWKHDLARLCFILNTLTFVSSLEIIENFGIH